MRRSAPVQPAMGGSARMPPLPLRAFAGGHPSAAAPAAASDRGRRHSGASSLSSARDAAREAVVSWGQNTWRSIGSRRNSSITEGTSVSRQASPRWSVSSKSPRRPPRHPRGHSAGAGSSTGASVTPGHSRASTPSVVWPVDSPQASYGRLPVGGKRPPGSQVVLGTTVVQDAYYSPGQPTLGGPNSVPKSAPTIVPPAGDVGAAHPRTGFAKFFSCFVQPSYQDLLSGDDYRRFTDLTTWLSYSYDDSNEHHSSKLAVLFDAAFHGKPYSSAAAGHWRRLGFQGDDPRRDFRGGGVAALDVMVYIAHHHFDVFKRVMNEGGDYGFALAVINLVYVIKRHLRLVYLTDADLRTMKLPPCGSRVMRNFAHAFASYAFFFHEVVCACLEVVHAQWMHLTAADDTLTLMQFNAGVLDDVPRAVNKAFGSPVLTQRQFRVRLAKAKGAIAFAGNDG